MTAAERYAIIIAMKAGKRQPTMTELLRKALAECKSLRAVDKATGVKRQAMALFLAGKQSLRLDKADALAAYFGIESRRRKGRNRG